MTTTMADAAAAETPNKVIEGELVDSTEGPKADDTAGAATEGDDTAGEETSSGDLAVPDSKAVETSDLTEKEARSLAAKIKKGLNGAADLTERMNKSVDDSVGLMAEAYGKRIWLALGQASWEDFVSTELGEVRVRLERGVRQSLAYQMAETAHMTTRAIAPVFGVDQKTVSNDLRQVRRELGVNAPGKATGKDGKVYDKTHARPRKQKPVEERFASAIEKADAVVGDLVAMSVEDGFAEAAGAVAKTHRAGIARLIDSLKGVQDRLQ